ncbi:MAG: pyridoxal-phosphate dependent enzyme, partial [Candidatus Competibacteraceae bacterium]|nr:pyridoxal-phosphate dependent enzyme [Candidatus Competibacteraceae bacterium]
PMGSVKDRLALGIIEEAERSGRLRPGQTVVEATSGNTGIGLAMVCARKGYPLVVVMAENFSIERRRLMRFLGAKVVLTPAWAMGSGMLDKARELAETHGWFWTHQFENEANAEIHSRTTAREILEDFQGRRLDYWVTGAGTGGTLKGVARVLARERPDTRVVVCEPDNAPLLAGGVPQRRRADGTPLDSHPAFRPHVVQGWSPDFVPKLTGDAVADQLVERIVPVSGRESLRLARELARREGIFTGISGGATLAGALEVCRTASQGSTVLCMLPDTGERYLSTPLFEDIGADMSEEELAISRSTASVRFDRDPPPVADKPSARAPVTRQAEAFIDRVIKDPDQPVVMFALEWCEFCWSVRRMFARYAIPYRSVDLDSVEYQADGLGEQIRAALIQRTGMPTIPQIFVGGEFMGGCSDTFDAHREGRLQGMLERWEVEYDRSVADDPYSFLPRWLQAR